MENAKFTGLNDEQVRQSRKEHGVNILTPPKRKPWWVLFLEKFEDPIIRILIIAAMLSISIGVIEGHYAEGIGIVIAIILATGIAFLNEYKANAEFDILNKVNDDIPVEVIRSGKFLAIPRKDLVVGDIFVVETGAEIPADGKVLESVGLQINEARLTGESLPVLKSPESTESEKDAYSKNSALRGTIVMDGHGTIEVTQVGDHTEIGQTAKIAAEETENVTPLNRQLEKLSKLIGVVAFAIAGILFASLLVSGIWNKEIVLSYEQWLLVGLSGGAIMIALSMVWLPIFCDALSLLGISWKPFSWMEEPSWKSWLVSVILAAVVLGSGLSYLVNEGILAQSPKEWIPAVLVKELLEYFMVAVTIIVVAVPEGLALSVTLCLAYSMRKMIANNNLVRTMHACETIGAANVICSDKTGTLTMNEMRVHKESFPYRTSSHLDEDELLSVSIAVNSTANLQWDKEQATVLGNATEGALLLWMSKNKVDYLPVRQDNKVIQQWSFSTEKKFMATLAEVKDEKLLLVKGAPEIVLDRSSQIQKKGKTVDINKHRKATQQDFLEYQKKGMRVIGFAYKKIEDTENISDVEEIAKSLVWLGFVAIEDPIRPDVADSIKACMGAGVDIKIVTGDNAETAKEIARKVGLWSDEDEKHPHALMTGPELNEWDDQTLQENAGDIKVLARAKPINKLKLVTALQRNKKVVAVTGDGTNDAPALNHADVGLSMGKTGTSIAKEASDIVLLDDSFTSITKAILWGRSLYQNIQRFLVFQLTINVAALGIALLGPFIGIKLPLTVMQMLWINLIMDTFAALALATEPPNDNLLKKKPRKFDAFIIDKRMAQMIFGTGIIFIVVMVSMIVNYLGHPPIDNSQEAHDIWVKKLSIFFSVFIFLQFWNMFNAKALGTGKSVIFNLFKNKAFLIIAFLIAVVQILIVQFGGEIFRTSPLSFTEWFNIIFYTSFVLWAGEFYRMFTKTPNENL